ncbi:hypothetical protein [Evansella tamaricis]|uniref:Uncharacterized protein n=1 Tax=Evansella tamaricis TaxID=2069301 RepID=A0ABS6JD61_9BACI|nr:hypothetical protein [Evansella tamaricis]MBU9711360.1 hypothetical protein [Evansella tamaricis]
MDKFKRHIILMNVVDENEEDIIFNVGTLLYENTDDYNFILYEVNGSILLQGNPYKLVSFMTTNFAFVLHPDDRNNVLTF